MKRKKQPLILYILLALMVACAFLASLTGFVGTAEFFKDPMLFWHRLARPLIRLTAFISVGLFVGQIIEGLGWTDKLAVMARPFMRWGHLSYQMGAAFTTAFFSGTASLSMLRSFLHEGGMSRKEITSAVLLNTFPSYFLHLPTTFFIILPLVGKAGGIYLLVTLGAAFLRLGAVLVYTHFTLPEPHGYYDRREPEKKNRKGLLLSISKKFKSRLINILLIVLPVYVVIAVLSDMGFFNWLRISLAGGVSSEFVPIEAMSVVIFSIVAEFSSGYAAAGAMLDAGTLSVFQTVLALLLGNIIAAPIRALRHQMPYYMGIFSPGLGTYLMVTSQAFRIISLAVAGLIFVLTANVFGYFTPHP